MARLYGKNIMLREFMQSDLEPIREWMCDDDITRYLSDAFALPTTMDSTCRYLDDILTGQAGGVHLVIADKQSGNYIGQLDLTHITDYSRKAEMMIVLLPQACGMGYGTEAIGLLLSAAFSRMNLNRVYLRVSCDNARAIACYEKCGFVREGVLREDVYIDGEYRDVLAMSILRDDWRKMNDRSSGGR